MSAATLLGPNLVTKLHEKHSCKIWNLELKKIRLIYGVGFSVHLDDLDFFPAKFHSKSNSSFGPWAGPGALGRHQTHDPSGWGVIIYHNPVGEGSIIT